MSNKEEERKLLLEELKYTDILLKLGKTIEEPYCLLFDDKGYDSKYNRLDLSLAIPKIAEKVTDEQLVSFFSENPAKGYCFRGRFYTMKDGRLEAGTEWPLIREKLEGLLFKHGNDLLAVLKACHEVSIEMGRKWDNYLYIEAVAEDLGAKGFRKMLTTLELAGVVIRHKGDIRIPPELGPLIEEFLDSSQGVSGEEVAKPGRERLTLPDDLFEDVIGHGEVKELLRACLLAEKPVHVLLAGPPALAKTLFLWDIERACGEKAIWLVGSATSRAGLWDLVAERQPQVLLIDELDKMNAADTAALLSMMEGGRLVRAKVGRELSLTCEIRVVAATNRAHLLSPELRSRFAIRELPLYSREEYLTVVKGVLVRRENASPELAEEIARRLDGRTQDVRDAVRAARLAPQLGVEKAVSLLLPRG
jgi:Holliday junction DNA helicase RuvB